jgi:hypothetical protein
MRRILADNRLRGSPVAGDKRNRAIIAGRFKTEDQTLPRPAFA